MPKIPSINSAPGAVTAGLTRFSFLGMNSIGGFNLNEAQTQVPMTIAGTISDFFVIVSTNAATTATTVVIRKNGADTAALVSIGAGLTGKFRVSASVSILPGDLVNVSQTTGATGTTTTTCLGAAWTPITRFQSPVVTGNGQNISTASTTSYYVIAGNKGSNTATQASVQYKLYSPGTFHGFAVYVSTNTRSTTTRVGFHVNNTTNDLYVDVGAGLTGLFRNNTVRVRAEMYSLINHYHTTSTGGGNFNAFMIKIDYVPDNRQDFILFWGSSTGVATTANLTRYFCPGGQASGDATESFRQADGMSKFTTTHFQAYVSANSLSDAATLQSRKNTADGNHSISIAAGGTGLYEVTSTYDTFLPSDLFDWELVSGTAGTSITFTQIACLGTVAPYPKFF